MFWKCFVIFMMSLNTSIVVSPITFTITKVDKEVRNFRYKIYFDLVLNKILLQ